PDLSVRSHTITACYLGGGSFSASSGSITQTVNKADQTITFGALGNKTYGDGDFTVSATASSGLTVSVSSQTTATCTVSGTTVHIVAAGTCTIRASQDGDLNYNAAPNVDQSFTINKKNATWTTDGDADPSPLTTGSGSGLLVTDGVTATYSRVAGENASPPTYHITATLSASAAGALNNYTITNSGAEFTINKKDATWTT